jgi:hypothetical protein
MAVLLACFLPILLAIAVGLFLVRHDGTPFWEEAGPSLADLRADRRRNPDDPTQ